MQRVLIIGGGTGGTMLANTLDKNRFEVTVISESLDHMFQPALLYVAFKHAEAAIVRNERRLLARHVRLVHQSVSRINLRNRFVTTGDGSNHEYDRIVVATGIRTDPGQVPGLAEVNADFGDYHSTIAQAEKLRSHLDAFPGGTIALGQSSPICKCPPSPLEGMLLIEELVRKRGLRDKTRLVFFTPYPRAYPAEQIDEIVEPILTARGIESMTFFDVDTIDPKKRLIKSIEGDTITYDLPIVIPPFVGADIAYEPTTILDASRFVKVDKVTLAIQRYENAFAIGDATNAPTSKSGVSAHLEAKVVARNLAGGHATFNGRTHCPIDLAYGNGTFVIGSYTAPVVRHRPSRLRHLMKMAMGRIYWLSLRGVLEPIFDWYFRRTAPERFT